MTNAARSSIVKVPKAAELVAMELRRRIVQGDVQPGDPLPSESELMAEFGVSRPSLREAFRILESEAIITVLRGARGGARVLEPDGAVAARHTGALLQYHGTPLRDVYQARTELEVSAIGLYGKRPRKAALAALDEIVTEAQSADDEASFAGISVRFHRAVVENAGNVTLAMLADMLYRILSAHNTQFIAAHPPGFEQQANRSAVKAYAKLVALLRAGDLVGAEVHWRKHLDAVERFMVGDSEATLVDVLS
ncbi:GntR family transcriptional regulator [Gordonia sp. VNQ95]|jgi:DNA-binding FadR family transcriptional regulator|uniref:FadR/GntR family transcriptional regulator n=1 Tax=Gordonia TaxID=2053 RepID=UPI0032B3AB05